MDARPKKARKVKQAEANATGSDKGLSLQEVSQLHKAGGLSSDQSEDLQNSLYSIECVFSDESRMGIFLDALSSEKFARCRGYMLYQGLSEEGSGGQPLPASFCGAAGHCFLWVCADGTAATVAVKYKTMTDCRQLCAAVPCIDLAAPDGYATSIVHVPIGKEGGTVTIVVPPVCYIPRPRSILSVFHRLFSELDALRSQKDGAGLCDKTLCDVGTGTGLIALLCKARYPELTVLVTDICEDALKVAHYNAELNNCSLTLLPPGPDVQPLLSDDGPRRVDFLISHPATDKQDERLDMSTHRYDGSPLGVPDPMASIDGGDTGVGDRCGMCESIVSALPSVLREGTGKAWIIHKTAETSFRFHSDRCQSMHRVGTFGMTDVWINYYDAASF